MKPLTLYVTDETLAQLRINKLRARPVAEYLSQVPALYHATTSYNWPKISTTGLRSHPSRKSWSFSKEGVTYWAEDPQEAVDYGNNGCKAGYGGAGEELLVLKIVPTQFAPERWSWDENSMGLTFELAGIIEPAQLVIAHRIPIFTRLPLTAINPRRN